MRGKQQCSVVVEAIDLSKMFSTSISKTWKVLHNLHMMLLCISWTCCIHFAAAPGPRSRIFWKLQIFWLLPEEQTTSLDVHMGKTFLNYCCPLWPIFLKVPIHSGYLLRVRSHHSAVVEAIDPFKILPHQDQTYLKCVTTVICCGCAYEWVLITLLLCLLAKLSKSSLEFWLPPEWQITSLFGGWR